MTTYSLIIKNILNIEEENIFEPNYQQKNPILYIHKLFFQLLLDTNEKINCKTKFLFFHNTIQNVFMLDSEYCEEFIHYFCRIQRIYKILNSFIAKYKHKKANIVVNFDMCLNEIRLNDKNIICILHYNSKYLFHINDLINIINTALTNGRNFFSEPISIKNPYNNLPFNKSTLYNIFFYIKYNTKYCPEFFINFYKCNFNLPDFAKQNEYLLREYAIKNYVYKSTSNLLKQSINNMLYKFNLKYKNTHLKCNINIDNTFPKDKLIKIMQPYLFIYITSEYSLLEHTRFNNERLLDKKLIAFYKFNPLFGRKKYKIETIQTSDFKKKITGKTIVYDDRHILFNNIEHQNQYFLSDHLECSEKPLMEAENHNERDYGSDSDTSEQDDFIYDDGDEQEYDDEQDIEEEEEVEQEEVEDIEEEEEEDIEEEEEDDNGSIS